MKYIQEMMTMEYVCKKKQIFRDCVQFKTGYSPWTMVNQIVKHLMLSLFYDLHILSCIILQIPYDQPGLSASLTTAIDF